MTAHNTCDNLTAFSDGELSAREAAEFRAHLATCDACEAGLLEQVTLVAQISTLVPMTWRDRMRLRMRRIGRVVRGWWRSIWWWRRPA
jgi:anti-sigma factor RsiW